jgi:hypothetical protein
MEASASSRATAELDKAYSKEATKKAMFKHYLEQHKVMHLMNHALQELYKLDELPKDPISFICSHLSESEQK